MRQITAYFKPQTLAEAVTLYQQQTGKGKFIGGGTQVAAERDPTLTYLIDLSGCGLDAIQEQAGHLHLGACVTLETLKESPLVRACAQGIIADVAAWTGSVHLRNSGTLGGSLVVQADIAIPLLTLDAQVVLMGEAERTVPLSAFYEGSKPIVRDGEVIKTIIIPPTFQNAAAHAMRLSRTRQDVSLVAVAAALLYEGNHCTQARLVAAPVASGLTRIPAAEALLQGHPLTEPLIDQVADTVRQTIQPVEDFRASAAYRRKIAAVYTKRMLTACLQHSALSST
ncbi:hypothetical protein GF339_05040 [candidate division KSB3 bacterium]|uniref:FAD-binding PCMH-type domain-containing protein n=1 Tax=candidate division KSB3 bacterium TaxID=2044937 RepID=A0A9D5JTH6_9BACT|nr:hypothetical protein [candidate division KSB3 bacterium]MBD3323927.1 hypothetical protein [candidate division KSB3 bacterium]